MGSHGTVNTFLHWVRLLPLPYHPQEQQQWGKMSTEYLEDFLSSTAKFGSMLTEAVATVSGGVELRMPDPRYIDQYGDLRPAGITQAAGDDDTLQVGAGAAAMGSRGGLGAGCCGWGAGSRALWGL